MPASIPGAPTHSKIVTPPGGPPASAASSGEIAASRNPNSLRRPYGASSPGSITTSAPSALAAARRSGDGSLAMIGPRPAFRSDRITASPIGPQPITSCGPSVCRFASPTACTPTASGSVSAARTAGTPSGAKNKLLSSTTTRVASPPACPGDIPTVCAPSGLATNGIAVTTDPRAKRPLVAGPTGSSCAANSCPGTIDGAPALVPASAPAPTAARRSRIRRSLPQIAVAIGASTTCPSHATGSSRSSTSMRPPRITAARIFSS